MTDHDLPEAERWARAWTQLEQLQAQSTAPLADLLAEYDRRADRDQLAEDKRILQGVTQELGGIVDAVTTELGIRRDAGPDTIVANIRCRRDPS